MQVVWFHPFIPADYRKAPKSIKAYTHDTINENTIFDRHAILFIKTIKSSSLKPGIPSVSFASLENDKCKVALKFPVNVDIKDTYDYFVSYLVFKYILRPRVSKMRSPGDNQNFVLLKTF